MNATSPAVICFVVCSMAWPAGASQERAPAGPAALLRLTLADAIARGVEASHRLAEIRARQDASRAAVAGREAADRPQVALAGGYMRTNHVDEFGVPSPAGLRVIYPDIPDTYRSRLDLQWPIYTGGRVDALARAARAELEATGKDLDGARGDLRLEIARAYWALVTANESVRVVEEALKRVDAQRQDVRNRLDVGLIPPSDVLSVEAQRSRQRVLLIEAQNTREVAAADVRRLIGVEAETPVELDAALEEPPDTVPAIGALLAEARRSRPEREAIERRARAAEARLEAAAAGMRPVIAIAGGVDYARPNPRIFPRRSEWNDSWDLSVNASWSLWDGGRLRAEVAEADAAARAARERLQEFDSVLELEVRQRALDFASTHATVGAAGDAVASAAEARRVVAERFSAGVATSTDLLDAQVTLLQAELERTRALANTRLAHARLDRSLGR